MKQELLDRIDILYSAEMINDVVVKLCAGTIDLLFSKKENYEQEKMEIFITHLAMATQRVIDNKIEGTNNPEIIEMLEMESSYAEAKNVLEYIVQDSSLVFPESEKQLLLIHLCNIL